MNGKTATLLRKQCLDTKGGVVKHEARALKKLWCALPKSLRAEKRAKFSTTRGK